MHANRKKKTNVFKEIFLVIKTVVCVTQLNFRCSCSTKIRLTATQRCRVSNAGAQRDAHPDTNWPVQRVVYDAHNEAFVDYENDLTYEQ